jgi:hypothetical protein
LEKSFHIGVAADYAVEGDDIGVWQRGGGGGEATEDELGGAGGVV